MTIIKKLKSHATYFFSAYESHFCGSFGSFRFRFLGDFVFLTGVLEVEELKTFCNTHLKSILSLNYYIANHVSVLAVAHLFRHVPHVPGSHIRGPHVVVEDLFFAHHYFSKVKFSTGKKTPLGAGYPRYATGREG